VRAGAYILDGLVTYAHQPGELYAGLYAQPDVDQMAAALARVVEAPSGEGEGP
jgi:hypothetical protein